MRIDAIVAALKDVRLALANEGRDKHAADVELGLDAIIHLQACLLDAADEMGKSTKFVTSRERIKHPEGTDYWMAAIEQARIDAREMNENGE